MKKLFIIFLFAIVISIVGQNAHAVSITFPGIAFQADTASGHVCAWYNESVYAESYCAGTLAIPLPAMTTISSIKVSGVDAGAWCAVMVTFLDTDGTVIARDGFADSSSTPFTLSGTTLTPNKGYYLLLMISDSQAPSSSSCSVEKVKVTY